MSFFGVQLTAQDDRLLLEIRLKLSSQKFAPNLRTLYRSFAQVDPECQGLVTPSQFEKAMNANGFFYKKFEIQLFQKAYANQDGKINWQIFLSHLREPMGPERRETINSIFDAMDKGQNQQIEASDLLSYFNPEEIQLFKQGKMTKEQLFDKFLSLIVLNEGKIIKQEFISYYDDCNINFPDTTAFIRYVSKMWSYEAGEKQVVRAEDLKKIVKEFRFKLIQKTQGTNDEFMMRKLFQQFDQNQNQAIGAYELDLMLKKLEIPAPPHLVSPLLEIFDRNKTGMIEYAEFREFIFFDPYPV